jgi:hypothetical protein
MQNTTGMTVNSNFLLLQGNPELKKKYSVSKPTDGRKIQYLSEINTFRRE